MVEPITRDPFLLEIIMNVKELSEFTGKNETTVRRWVKKASAKMPVINDKMTVSTWEEIKELINE